MKKRLLKNSLMAIAFLMAAFSFAQPVVTIVDVQQTGTIPVAPLSTATFEITYKTDGSGADITGNTWRMYQSGAVSPGFVQLVYAQTNGAEATIEISFEWPEGFASGTNYGLRLFNANPKEDFDWAPLNDHYIGKTKNTQTTPFVPETDWLQLGGITVDVATPPIPQSEFILDPSFEESTLANYNGTGGGGGVASRSINTVMANVQEGAQSLAMTWTSDAENGTGTGGGPGPYWNFGQYVEEYAQGVITSNSVATVTIWVKSTRSAQARIISRIRTRNASNVNLNQPSFPTDTQLTSGTADTWEELTFTMPIPFDETDPATEVRDMTFWFGVDYDDTETALNANNGDIFYFDNMSAALGTLSIKGNTLEGVSAYPNPASDVLTLNTSQGGDITVFNILGAQVKADKTDLKQYRMNVSDLKSGMYLLRVTSEGKQFTQKLVID